MELDDNHYDRLEREAWDFSSDRFKTAEAEWWWSRSGESKRLDTRAGMELAGLANE